MDEGNNKLNHVILLDGDSSVDGFLGGKGKSLQKLKRDGFPSLPGFVITYRYLKTILDSPQLQNELRSFDEISHKDLKSLKELSKSITSQLESISISESFREEVFKVYDDLNLSKVAVRSSALMEDSSANSCAGCLETFLNVSKNELIKNIVNCWKSLFSLRSLYYLKSKNIQSQDLIMSVVIQKMAEPRVAGVCFTRNPVTSNPHEILIEAGIGLGEVVVNGSITPDRYIVDENFNILLIEVGKQDTMISTNSDGIVNEKCTFEESASQKLPDKHIIELSRIAKDIEKANGMPMDIEWALTEVGLIILQARPITTL